MVMIHERFIPIGDRESFNPNDGCESLIPNDGKAFTLN